MNDFQNNLHYLSNCIDDHRSTMYELVNNKGFTHPDVLKISQKIDRKIILLQKLMVVSGS
ncbi:aspartyl-phosphate phosphatase Spo0E family protein [Metabacillus sediminilitoris]|uniref:Aspartyl-phosphate phosphatase Spo0E family protein n=1 Tax=Metabacillus sediminilitoris TaxID=2567941 RepID=A0A4S4C186_9BACI|nr:aspartyl-phosphate phosphatase Spo0E family protein [Metabacillus sediminilitoris]QGQ48252.1 Spo0E family sporulation regulatory protein-aspartic acid phosphatase [Metabacillus sediminilitoris]THF81390.1 aspartyl-phosphate phosphatase Spo0E family protein [Metabacillus sediminilitoris]